MNGERKTLAGQMELARAQFGELGNAILDAVPGWMRPGLRMAARFLWG